MQKRNRKQQRKEKLESPSHSWLSRWAVPLIALTVFGAAVLVASAQFDPVDTRVADDTASFNGIGEKADYVVDGETVYINNRLCAVSHSRLDPQNLDEYTSRVRYDGPFEAFKGKTLVFNQCCDMCIKKFPNMWRESRDEILKYHGILPQQQTGKNPKE